MPPTQPTTKATSRIDALSNQLSPATSTSTSTKMSSTTPAAAKPPITCHVLDTTIGRPASSIPVTLTLHNPPASLSSSSSSTSTLTFTSVTNGDGRVTSWDPSSPSTTLENVFTTEEGEPDQVYSLRFNTEKYFGEKGVQTFFPEVEVRFVVRGVQRGINGDGDGEKEHFHVPVLLGPFGYTTYRGS